MTDLFGPLPRHDVASLPWVVGALAPLVAALVTGLFGAQPRAGGRLAPGSSSLAARVAAGGCAVAAAACAAALVAALGSPSGLAIAPAWTLLRVGSVDASLGLDADAIRAALALALSIAGAAHALRGALDARGATVISLAVASGVAGLLADGFAVALVAVGGALVGSGYGARGARWAPAALGVGAMLLGAVVLGWGLEGRWLRGLRGDYLSDYAPRFIAVLDEAPKAPRPRGPAAAEGKGSLSMTSAPGAEVFVGVADDASLRTRRAPLATAPFQRVPVPAVLQKIAIVPGGAAVVGGEGLEVALADAVDVRAGEDVVLLPIGATWTYRDLEAQLALRDAKGAHPPRSELAQKRLAGASVPTAVLAALFLAAIALLVDAPRRFARAFALGGRGEAGLVAAAIAVCAVVPAARAGGLVPLASGGVLFLLAAVVVAMGVAVAALGKGTLRAASAALGGAALGLIAVVADAPALAAPLAALGAVAAAWTARPAAGASPRLLAGDEAAELAAIGPEAGEVATRHVPGSGEVMPPSGAPRADVEPEEATRASSGGAPKDEPEVPPARPRKKKRREGKR